MLQVLVLKLQQVLQWIQKFIWALANLLKKAFSTVKGLITNIK